MKPKETLQALLNSYQVVPRAGSGADQRQQRVRVHPAHRVHAGRYQGQWTPAGH